MPENGPALGLNEGERGIADLEMPESWGQTPIGPEGYASGQDFSSD